MNSALTKIKTYIGFATKSRNIKFGVDDIIKLKKCDIILLSTDLKEASKNKLINYSNKASCEHVIINDVDFKILVDNKPIKALAILENNLACAIKKYLTSI